MCAYLILLIGLLLGLRAKYVWKKEIKINYNVYLKYVLVDM